MVNPKWGAKRQCQECGARFYDLKRAKIICPKCDTPFKADPPPKARRAIAPAVKEEVAPVAKEPAAVEAPATELEEKAGGAEESAPESAEDKALKDLAVEVPGDGAAEADKEEEEDAAFEDASELGEDKDDMAEVVEDSRVTDGT